MPPLEDYRYQTLTSTSGGVAQRWLLVYSELRRAAAQRTVDKQWRKQSAKESTACKQLCRTTFACEADAQQALAAFALGLETMTDTPILIRRTRHCRLMACSGC